MSTETTLEIPAEAVAPDYGDPRLPDFFWDRVFPEPNTGCWLWGRGCTSEGYGQGPRPFYPLSRLAHRVTYLTLVRILPEELELDHLCRQRPCCNPAHLEPVTSQVNNLRGVGWAAVHSVKVACPQGHLYTPENTQVNRGKRYCRACRREAIAARRAAWTAGMRASSVPTLSHCKNGHEFTEINSYWNKGSRSCRLCRQAASARSLARRALRARTDELTGAGDA